MVFSSEQSSIRNRVGMARGIGGRGTVGGVGAWGWGLDDGMLSTPLALPDIKACRVVQGHV